MMMRHDMVYETGRNLLHTELAVPHIATEAAHFLARLHSVKLDTAAALRLPRDPVLIRNLNDWYKRLDGISFPTDASTIPAVLKDTVTPKQWAANQERKQAMLDALGIGHGGSLAREIQWLKDKVATYNSPIVFCHNDAQEGNLLYYDPNEPQSEPGCTTSFTIDTATSDSHSNSHGNGNGTNDNTGVNGTNGNGNMSESFIGIESKRRTPLPQLPIPGNGWQLLAIDFEYAAFNYRGFDLGNHMCEHLFNNNYEHYPYYGVDHDNFPSPHFMRAFCREYIKAQRVLQHNTYDRYTRP
jgi:thiamine kinase-like enzyme